MSESLKEVYIHICKSAFTFLPKIGFVQNNNKVLSFYEIFVPGNLGRVEVEMMCDKRRRRKRGFLSPNLLTYLLTHTKKSKKKGNKGPREEEKNTWLLHSEDVL